MAVCGGVCVCMCVKNRALSEAVFSYSRCDPRAQRAHTAGAAIPLAPADKARPEICRDQSHHRVLRHTRPRPWPSHTLELALGGKRARKRGRSWQNVAPAIEGRSKPTIVALRQATYFSNEARIST